MSESSEVAHSVDHTDRPCPYPQLKARVDNRLVLRDLYQDYWRVRLAGTPELSEVYANLLSVAIELYSFIASYHYKTGVSRLKPEDDPRLFWSMAQPSNAAEAGIIDIYVDIIINENFLHSPPALVDHILWGFGALFWMRNYWINSFDRGGKKSVYAHIFSHTKRLWAHLWENRGLIKPRPQSERDAEGYGSMSVDPAHDILGNYPEPYSRLLEWYSYLYEGHVNFLRNCTPEERALELEYVGFEETFMPHVALVVWSSGNSQSTPSGKDLALHQLTSRLLSHRVSGPKFTERIAREAVVEGIGAKSFFSQFETMLSQRHPAEYEPGFPIDGVQIVVLLSMTPALCGELANYDVFRPIVRVCNFYGRTRKHWFWETVLMFFMFVTNFPVGLPVPDEYKECQRAEYPLVRGGDIIDFVSRGLDIIADWTPATGSLTSFNHRKHTLQRYIFHYVQLIASTRDKPETHDRRERKRVKEMLARMPSQWWPCLKRLQLAHERGQPCQDILQDWILIGNACDLDMVNESMRFALRDAKQHCSLNRCEYHTNKPPDSLRLKTCKGCGEVKYCSKLCQVQHWKEEHKRR
ncbi:unnamed protein product, partial [Peniophora sp. CBMAI 1063]